MTNILLTPLIAFVVYLLVVAAFSGLGRMFSAKSRDAASKSTMYASGEVHDPYQAAPGYRQFFVVALFFAVLHLGILMVGTSGLAPVTNLYLLGLILALIALILG
jgi:NADH:ubiquinone oxidoreductase subunit 3 (subunit A)